jgi:predicted CopG family antitoxin
VKLKQKRKDKMDIELMGWIGEEMSDEEIIAMIDEIEAEEDAREELSDFAMNFEV